MKIIEIKSTDEVQGGIYRGELALSTRDYLLILTGPHRDTVFTKEEDWPVGERVTNEVALDRFSQGSLWSRTRKEMV